MSDTRPLSVNSIGRRRRRRPVAPVRPCIIISFIYILYSIFTHKSRPVCPQWFPKSIHIPVSLFAARGNYYSRPGRSSPGHGDRCSLVPYSEIQSSFFFFFSVFLRRQPRGFPTLEFFKMSRRLRITFFFFVFLFFFFF